MLRQLSDEDIKDIYRRKLTNHPDEAMSMPRAIARKAEQERTEEIVEWLEKKNNLDALSSVLKAGHTVFISQGLFLNSADLQELKAEVK